MNERQQSLQEKTDHIKVRCHLVFLPFPCDHKHLQEKGSSNEVTFHCGCERASGCITNAVCTGSPWMPLCTRFPCWYGTHCTNRHSELHTIAPTTLSFTSVYTHFTFWELTNKICSSSKILRTTSLHKANLNFNSLLPSEKLSFLMTPT